MHLAMDELRRYNQTIHHNEVALRKQTGRNRERRSIDYQEVLAGERQNK